MNDDVLIKYLLKETNSKENDEVSRWIRQTPENQAYFAQFEKIWNSSKNLAFSSTVDEQQAWERFKAKTSETNSAKTVWVSLSSTWLRIAAILLLITSIWLGYEAFAPIKYNDLSAGNSVLERVLTDGSILTLNKNAEISYAANFEDNRSIKLNKGDVFFEVAHNKNKPFTIEAGKVTVTVVGTAFNVKKAGNQTEVNVRNGIVRVSLGNQQMELRRGDRILINATNEELLVEKNTDALYDYYESRLLRANGTSVGKLLIALNEAYGSKVYSNNPQVLKMKISTVLPLDSSLESNLKTICKTMDLKIVRNHEQILLSTIK